MDISVTLTFNVTIQFLHNTLQLMIMCHQIKCGCKGISGSVGMVEKVKFDYIMSSRRDRDLEDGKPIFMHDAGP